MSTISESSGLTVSERAAEKVRELAGGAALLRLGVQGGGCGGFQYLLALEEKPQDDDSEFKTPLADVRLIVDPWSLPYLEGSTVDFVDSLQESGFKVDNPKASASCGCGQSFRIDEDGCPTSTADDAESEDVYV